MNIIFQPAATYETNKTYYTPTAAPAAAAATAVYTVADASFQTGKYGQNTVYCFIS